MKHTINDLNDLNELVMFSISILDNFCFDTFFEELEAQLSPCANSDKQFELLHSNQIFELNCTLIDHSNDALIISSCCTLVNSSLTNHCTQLTNHNLWTLYFETSRNMHGEGASYLLIDLCGIQTYLAYYLESKCIDNDAEYKA